MRRKHNVIFNILYFRRFLFFLCMSPDVPTVKVHVLTINFKNWTLVGHFAHFFYFHRLTNFVKCLNLLCKASLWCEILRKRPIYTSQSNRWIPLLWANELERLLIIFIYFNSKFKVTCNECRCIKSHSEEKSLKFILFQSAFCFFFFSLSTKFVTNHPENFGVYSMW